MGTRQKNLNLSHSIKILGINLSFCWGYFKFVAIKNTQLFGNQRKFFLEKYQNALKKLIKKITVLF